MSLYTRTNAAFNLHEINTKDATDAQLAEVSGELGLGLSLHEMKQVQTYFKTQKRNPTDVELQTIGQTWSEHCYHKTFKGKIRFERQRNRQPLQNLHRQSHQRNQRRNGASAFLRTTRA